MKTRFWVTALLALWVAGGSNASSLSTPAQFSVTPPAPSTGLKVLAIGGNSGNQAANVVFSSGDLPGSIDRSFTTGQFNSMTPAQLRAAYDIIYVTWDGDPGLNLDWTTRLLPFLNLGGGVMFEDPNNANDLIPAVSTSSPDSGEPPYTFTASVPGLTTGVSADFVNHHFLTTGWISGFNPFIFSFGDNSTIGLYGQFGTGRIVITGNDQDYHSTRGDPGTEGNQYNFLVNEFRWAGATVLSFVQLRQDTLSRVGPGGITASYASLLVQIIDLARLRFSQGQAAAAITLLKSYISYVQRSTLSGPDKAGLTNEANALISLLGGVVPLP